MSKETVYPVENAIQITDWMNCSGVKIPRFLITQRSFEKKLRESQTILNEVKEEFAQGTATTDAGDTHGQYHNEYEWYRQQSLQLKEYIGSRIGQYLNRAEIISGYDEVRTNLERLGVNPGNKITLTSRVRILYKGEETPEDIMIVSMLDGNQEPGWVSIESPLGSALVGHHANEEASFKLMQKNAPATEIGVKILSVI